MGAQVARAVEQTQLTQTSGLRQNRGGLRFWKTRAGWQPTSLTIDRGSHVEIARAPQKRYGATGIW
jgi:hypothetical protein